MWPLKRERQEGVALKGYGQVFTASKHASSFEAIDIISISVSISTYQVDDTYLKNGEVILKDGDGYN